jgi:hypothetical protein
MKRIWHRVGAIGGWLVAIAAISCSSNSAAPATCDPSKCAAGNQCIDDGHGDVQCRLVCQDSGQAGCPTNYHCLAASPLAYCAADKVSYQTSSKVQWGAPCVPSGGFDNNPACDSDQNFWCYGRSPIDADAFCTQYQCTDDTDCRGGWWCATINQAPNVVQTARSIGQTTRVCLPRTYCSTCATDLDCSPVGGVTQHCVQDANGAGYCSPECSADSNCNNEAKCTASDSGDFKYCAPRAGVCVGDGTLCAPCRSDGDCPNGVCVGSEYSTEHFCTVKSPTPCGVDANNHLVGATCPTTDVAKAPITCEVVAYEFAGIPKDQCFGVFTVGTGSELSHVPGCFTPAR